MKRWLVGAGLMLMVASLLLPAGAFAKGAASRTVTTVSGVQIAEQLVGQLRSVQLGSTSATVTLGAGETASPVRFDFGDVADAVEGRPGGWLAFAAVPMLGVAAIRFLDFLAKLGAR